MKTNIPKEKGFWRYCLFGCFGSCNDSDQDKAPTPTERTPINGFDVPPGIDPLTGKPHPLFGDTRRYDSDSTEDSSSEEDAPTMIFNCE